MDNKALGAGNRVAANNSKAGAVNSSRHRSNRVLGLPNRVSSNRAGAASNRRRVSRHNKVGVDSSRVGVVSKDKEERAVPLQQLVELKLQLLVGQPSLAPLVNRQQCQDALIKLLGQ